MPATADDRESYAYKLGVAEQTSRRLERGIREIEAELREQASGSQDGYLLDVANRLHALVADK